MVRPRIDPGDPQGAYLPEGAHAVNAIVHLGRGRRRARHIGARHLEPAGVWTGRGPAVSAWCIGCCDGSDLVILSRSAACPHVIAQASCGVSDSGNLADSPPDASVRTVRSCVVCGGLITH